MIKLYFLVKDIYQIIRIKYLSKMMTIRCPVILKNITKTENCVLDLEINIRIKKLCFGQVRMMSWLMSKKMICFLFCQRQKR